ncbi:MAG: hypothetical protein UZ16_OP3001003206 [Candidatus Hinthialibacteria bacterium OLB16]|nr:MAG: hypothetical protein UZ16_OP3001003206 [Candidatus Hinthialibacteria bacterium OLB16]
MRPILRQPALSALLRNPLPPHSLSMGAIVQQQGNSLVCRFYSSHQPLLSVLQPWPDGIEPDPHAAAFSLWDHTLPDWKWGWRDPCRGHRPGAGPVGLLCRTSLDRGGAGNSVDCPAFLEIPGAGLVVAAWPAHLDWLSLSVQFSPDGRFRVA